MTETQHEAMAALVHRAFTGEITPRENAAPQAHLRECAACEALYDRYSAAERWLYPERDDEEPTPAALARVEARLAPARPSEPRRRWPLPLGMGALAAALALSFGVRELVEEPQLRARGAAPSDGARVSLRVLRLREEEGSIAITDLASAEPRLLDSDRVILLYANHAGAEAVSVWLEHADQVRPLLDDHSVSDGVEDARLGPPIAVADWPRGEIDVVAAFRGGPREETWRRVVTVRRGDEP